MGKRVYASPLRTAQAVTDEQLRVIAARRSAEPSGADRMERSEDERSTAERGADQSETE